MTASEKAAYLKGLAEGLGITADSDEGKLMLAMIDVIGDLARDIEDLEANTSDLADAIDDIGDDMAYIEDLCYGGADEGGFPACDGDCSGCSGCGDEPEYEVTCPECGKTVTVYEDDLEFGSILCPECGTELGFDDDEDGDE